jgi:FkbM family methyltransferase
MRYPFVFTIPFLRIPIIQNIGMGNVLLPNKWIRPFLRDYLMGRKGAYVDVGANIGEMLLHVKRLDPNRPCVAIEPNPTCVDYLLRIKKAQGWKDVTIIPCAAGGEFGFSTLFLYNKIDVDTSASLQRDFEPHLKILDERVVVRVPVSALREIVPDVALVKIDVQGEEAVVVREFLDVYADQKPVFIVETEPNERFAKNHRVIETSLAVHGYRILRIDPVKGVATPIDRFPLDNDLTRMDFLFLPK